MLYTTHTGYIARNQAKNEGVEDLYAVVEGKNESRIRLERYDMVSYVVS